jgi:uncharacterized membrane protein
MPRREGTTMTTVTPQLQKVQKYSRSLQRVFKFSFGVVLLGAVASLLLLFRPSDGPILLGGIELVRESLTGWSTVFVVAFIVLYYAVWLKIFYHLIRLFGLYADAKIFTRDNVTQIRQIGIAILVFPALWVFALLALAPAMVGDSAVSPRSIVPSSPMPALVVGAIVMIVSWIMDVGRELREHDELVI